MRRTAYLRIECLEIDVNLFAQHMEGKLEGSIRKRRHNGEPFSKLPLSYWASCEASTQNPDVQELLYGLLTELEKSLKGTMLLEKIRITAVIVAEINAPDDAMGFYVSKEMVLLLSRLHADVDIDQIQSLN